MKSGKGNKLEGHTNAAWTLLPFHHDLLISGSLDGTMRVWNPESKICLKTINAHPQGQIYALANLGRHLVATGSATSEGKQDTSIRTWNISLPDSKMVNQFDGHKKGVTSLAVTNDMLVSQAMDATVRVWDYGVGRHIKTIEGTSDYVSTVVVTYNGKIITEDEGYQIGLWDPKTGNRELVWPGHERRPGLQNDKLGLHMRAFTVISDTIFASGSNQFDIKFWDIRQQARALKTFTGHTNYVNALVTLSNRYIASTSGDRSVKLWDINADDCVATLDTSHNNWIQGLTLFKGDTLVSGSGDHTIGLHPLSEFKLPANTLASITDFQNAHAVTRTVQEENPNKLKGHIKAAWAVLPYEDILLSGSCDGTVRIWNATYRTCLKTVDCHPQAEVMTLAGLPNKRQFITASTDKSIKFWSLPDAKLIQTLNGHQGPVYSLAIADNALVSQGQEGVLKVWDIDAGVCLRTIDNTSQYVSTVIVTKNGSVISEAKDYKIGLWDPRTGKLERTWEGHTDPGGRNNDPNARHMRAFAMMSEYTFVSGSTLNDIKSWDLRTDRPQAQFLGHTSYVNALVPMSDRLFASGSGDKSIKIWNVTDAKIVGEIKNAHSNWIQGLALLPDFTLVSASGDNDVGVFALDEFHLPRDLLPQPQKAVVGGAAVIVAEGKVLLPKEVAGRDKPRIEVNFEIEYKDIQLIRRIGKGANGEVHYGQYKFQKVAVKRLTLENPTPKAIEEFKTEITTMAGLRAANIVQFFGYCLGNPYYCIVMEYMSKGSLFDTLAREDLPWKVRYQIMKDLSAGLAFLHDKEIIHRDLKSLNVLLDEQYRVKLGDFGLSRMKNETKNTTADEVGGKGTIPWMAPELFKAKAKYGKRADMYGLGMIFWEIASRKVPFEDVPNPFVIPSLVAAGQRPDIPKDIPDEYKLKVTSLIRFCWEGDRKKRPTAARVVQYLESDEKEFKASEVEPKSSASAAASKK